MITFSEQSIKGLPEKRHICTFCGEKYKFYNVSPRRCVTCDRTFPDMAKLYNSKNHRVKYHTFEK